MVHHWTKNISHLLKRQSLPRVLTQHLPNNLQKLLRILFLQKIYHHFVDPLEINAKLAIKPCKRTTEHAHLQQSHPQRKHIAGCQVYLLRELICITCLLLTKQQSNSTPKEITPISSSECASTASPTHAISSPARPIATKSTQKYDAVRNTANGRSSPPNAASSIWPASPDSAEFYHSKSDSKYSSFQKLSTHSLPLSLSPTLPPPESMYTNEYDTLYIPPKKTRGTPSTN